MKHFLSIRDLSQKDMEKIFSFSAKLKKQLKKGIKTPLLKGKTLGMIFNKSSTRTRVSFETGMYQLGGHALFLNSNDIQMGRGETIPDTAKILSGYLDGIMIRTFKHEDVEQLSRYSTIPVINGLTDLLHPCQVLADLFTLYEVKGKLKGLKLAYTGDGNNVANSLIYGCSKAGVNLSVATPKGYECNSLVVEEALMEAKNNDCHIEITNDPEEAVKMADAIYTDTWVSMGQEAEKEKRIKIFADYQVNSSLFKKAKGDAVFLHCLPAYRGLEVTEEIIDGPHSVVFQEAENRLHVQKTIMAMLMG